MGEASAADTVTGSQPIESGDRIELGSTELVFELA